ncbi:MAG: hypothetical protein PVJ67_03970 [Candidatus Pacearchaeota archaeon]
MKRRKIKNSENFKRNIKKNKKDEKFNIDNLHIEKQIYNYYIIFDKFGKPLWKKYLIEQENKQINNFDVINISQPSILKNVKTITSNNL